MKVAYGREGVNFRGDTCLCITALSRPRGIRVTV